ncbi:hypothetical protein GCM10009785_30940 [Brooklawnia cerclae]|uniref:ABC-type lipoprotein release transport system permease subunit n=1 Tax=Brooklawnia cerclae TaxID=349934 RepID=A0ABX0SDZ5_9ACTN|nr:FtsX-like permease family protein [Brooklawnia cerclae]NIH56615.1 ABC-type lipoprotein release transport system permease subunit [Brooklawnia cerclae]
MRYLVLALRNIQNNVRRSATIAVFVFISVLVYLLLNAAVTSAQQKVDGAIVNSLLGHVQIRPDVDEPTAVIDMSADWGSPDHLTTGQTDQALEAARDSDRNAAAYRLIRTNMLVAKEGFDPVAFDSGDTSGAQIPSVAIGVDEGMHEYEKNLVLDSGAYLGSGGAYEVILSTSVAKQLDIVAGDTVTLISEDVNEEPTSLEARVAGIGNAQSLGGFEGKLCYLSYGAAAHLKGLDETASSEVIAFAKSTGESSALADDIDAAMGSDVIVTDWSTQGGYISAINLAYTGVFYIFLLIILLIVCILIVNMVSVAGLERTHEIATLRAIGFDRGRIVTIFVAEVLGAAVTGALVAYVVAAAIGIPLSSVTFAVGAPADAVVGQSFALDYDMLAGLPGIVLILLFVALATLMPSFHAASKDPAAALIEE